MKPFNFTRAFGISRRNLIEHPKPLHDLSYRQLQGFGQFKWMIKSSESNRSYAFCRPSVNRNDLSQRQTRSSRGWWRATTAGCCSGFLRAGLGTTGLQNTTLLGRADLRAARHCWLFNRASAQGPRRFWSSPRPSPSDWRIGSRTLVGNATLELTARAAGQAALNSLPFDMGFSLG